MVALDEVIELEASAVGWAAHAGVSVNEKSSKLIDEYGAKVEVILIPK